MVAIHECGVQHNDIEPRNIVVKDGIPLIIDLEHASAHDCRCKTIIYEGAYCPDEYDFGCSEIYQYARKACVWRPGTSTDLRNVSLMLINLRLSSGHFMVAGVAVPEHCATSLEEIEDFVRDRDIICTPEFLRREAENALKLADLIEEYGGYRPRMETLKERGILLH